MTTERRWNSLHEYRHELWKIEQIEEATSNTTRGAQLALVIIFGLMMIGLVSYNMFSEQTVNRWFIFGMWAATAVSVVSVQIHDWRRMQRQWAREHKLLRDD